MTEKAVQFDWEKITGPLGKTEDIFKDEIERIEKLCKEYGFEKNSSNVISIVGNRGCGKTSLIKAVQKHFKPKDDKEKNISDDEKARYKNFYVTDTIDPSIFDDTLLIPEFFISVLAQQVEKSKENSSYEFAEFHKKLNEIMGVISHIKSNKERFYEDNHPSDIVRTIQKRYRFDELLKELMTSFYKAIGKATDTKMIVCIDDLDLVSNKYVYRMIEDIQKWLNKNCIIILSFREVQLLNIIQDYFVKQNKYMLEHGAILFSEIKEQATQFYEKQMPVSRRIYLKGQKEFFSETTWDILKPFIVQISDEKQKEYEKTNFHDFMEKLVWDKVALPLDPVDEKERVHLIYPNGLREMLAFVRMLVEMPEIRDKDDSILKEKLQQNLKNYKNYILYRAKANLDERYYLIIDEWNKTSIDNKNYYICSKIDKILRNNSKYIGRDYHSESSEALSGEDELYDEESIDDDVNDEDNNIVLYDANISKNDVSATPYFDEMGMLYIENTEAYNICIGDVIRFIDKIKWAFSSSEQYMYIVYLIKVMYSIELLFCLMKSTGFDKVSGVFDINYDENDEYLLLINGKFVPDNFTYTSGSENLLNYIDVKTGFDNSKTDFILNCLNKIGYSRIKRKSGIWKAARPKDAEQRSYYKYRPVFTNETIVDLQEIKGKDDIIINHVADPLTYIIKREYFTSQKTEKNKFGGYVFYSLFDVDAIVRIVFDNKRKNKITGVYKKINWMLSGDDSYDVTRNKLEIKFKRKISKLFKWRGNIFDDEFIKNISELEKSFNKSIDFIKIIENFNIYEARAFVVDIINSKVLKGNDFEDINKVKESVFSKSRRKLNKDEIKTISDICRKYPKLQDLIK